MEFANGMSAYQPHREAPDYIKVNLLINVEKFVEWLNEQEANDKGNVKVDILSSKKDGRNWYAKLDDYVPKNKGGGSGGDMGDDVPFAPSF